MRTATQILKSPTVETRGVLESVIVTHELRESRDRLCKILVIM